VVVLDLVEEPSFDSADPRLLRFSDGTLTVEVRIAGHQARLVTVDVLGQQDVTVSLDQLAPSLRLVRTGIAPARFEEVNAGFFSVVVTLPDLHEPERCTAWTRL
jgi:hypothetical protein